MPVSAARVHDDAVGGRAKITYDFAFDGGAVGAIPLDLKLPDKAIIFDGFLDVIVPPTSGGAATIALGLNAAADLRAATAIASITGRLALVPVGTAASAIKLTAERQLAMTIAAAALTAGRINIFLDYYISD